MAYGTPQQTHRRPPPPRRGIPAWVWIVGAVAAAGVIAPFLIMDALKARGDHLGSGSKTTAPALTHSVKPTPAWPPTAVPVTSKQLGKAWPFKAPTVNGFVGCDAQHPLAIIFNPGSGPYLAKPFALNGFARAWGYPDVPKRIWLKDPAIPDPQARMDITPLQERAPNRCEK